MKTALAALLLLAALPLAAAERWRLSYSYDGKVGTSFTITCFAAPSPMHAIAAGYQETGGKSRPYAVVTTDGGTTWTAANIPATPVSMSFVNERTGWMVAPSVLYQTTDAGATWKKIARTPNIIRVKFLDERHGWAIGMNKTVRESTDGGVSWKDVPAAAEPKTTPERTVYNTIAFANNKAGIICGYSRPAPRKRHTPAPEWMDPESTEREVPHSGIRLATIDGGSHWAPSEVSMFGQVTDVSLAGDGRGLAVVSFRGRFDYPSEVYRIDARTGQGDRAFRSRERAITAALVSSEGPAYLAGFEPSGSYVYSPVPGKLKVLKSDNLVAWQETEVDYRALARRAMLASGGPGTYWVATDTGTVLKLVP